MAGRFIAPSEQYFDNSGNVLSGGKLYFYDSGTAIAKDTYSDPDGTVANTNPVVLDSAGRTPDIYLDGSYKLIIKDSSDAQIEERDPVLAADDTTKGFAVWNAVTTYSVDDIVRGSNNLLYISIANSNQNFEPSANATKWSQVQLLGTYNANQSYSIGDVVIDSIGDVYRSLTNSNSGNTPASSPSNWTTVVAGAFSGDVSVGGALYVGTTVAPSSSQKGWAVLDNSGVGEYTASGVSVTTNVVHSEYYNPNGTVGSISTNGSATAFNTSSDPRLKSDFVPFESGEAWRKFDQILSASGKFHFLADPNYEVWGSNAHSLIDADLGVASEGLGPRDLAIGDVYQQAQYDDEGNEITPELVVTPAGVDQSKIVPYLIAVIDDLRNRVNALEN